MTAPESNTPEVPEGSKRPFVFGDVVANAAEPDWGTGRFLKSHPIDARNESAVLVPEVNVRFWRTNDLVLVSPAPWALDSREASWAAYCGATSLLKASRDREATTQAILRAARTELQILRDQAANTRPFAGYLVRQGYEKNKGSYVRHEDGFQWRFSRRDASVFSREVAEHAAGMMTGDVRIVPTRRKP